MLEESVKLFENNRDEILSRICVRFEIKPGSLSKLGSFESLVYEYPRDGKEYILKITHSLHRSEDLIMGELDWVNYLATADLSVCEYYPSVNGNLVESITVGDSSFHGYICEKAKGEFTNASNWNERLFESWGAMIGRMHGATKKYRPSRESYRRFHWYNDPSINIADCLPDDQIAVVDKAEELIEKLKELPTDSNNYGLIHSDLHTGNFVAQDGVLTAFDFDDCHYDYFAFDIMIPLYYAMLDESIGDDNTEFAGKFFKHFISGYRRENKVEKWWLEYLPDFMKLREIDLYSVILRENAHETNDWCRRFMAGKRERIENDIQVIDMDFSDF